MVVNVIVFILLIIFAFLLLWQFVGYPILMIFVVLRSTPKDKNYYQPPVSVVVPTYNEERVIKKRMKNLLDLDYPKDKYEILVVDSGSTDKTAEIVEETINEHENNKPNLRLLKEEERKGKASAINIAKKHARSDIILVTDANSIFDRNVLKEMMPHFENPKIGAVGGRYVVANIEKTLASSESFYWDLEYIMRIGESIFDSACTFHGEINAWRKNIVGADTKMVAEDLDMAIQIRRAGYKIDYEPNAIVYEPSAITPEEQIKQRKRTALGVIQCISKHWDYFLFPQNPYNLLIFPSHKALPMFSPFILLAIPILYIAAWNAQIIITHFVLTLLIFAGMLALLIFLKPKLTKDERMKTGFSISSIPKIVYYVLLNEYLILLAWKDFILGRYSVLWEKVGSTRE